jgi:hypothetical protein
MRDSSLASAVWQAGQASKVRKANAKKPRPRGFLLQQSQLSLDERRAELRHQSLGLFHAVNRGLLDSRGHFCNRHEGTSDLVQKLVGVLFFRQ